MYNGPELLTQNPTLNELYLNNINTIRKYDYICKLTIFFMSTFTYSLPDPLLDRLGKAAQKLKIPKNKLIERALEVYLDQLKRAEYVASYKKSGKDKEIMLIAEEGMADYLSQLNNHEAG